MSKEAIEAVVTAYFANMAAMNPDSGVDNFAEDAVIHDPVGRPPVKVSEGFRESLERIQNTFLQLQITTEHIFIAGNEAAVKWTTQGVSKSEKSVTFEGITVFEVNDAGKIQTLYTYWNPAELVAQLKS